MCVRVGSPRFFFTSRSVTLELLFFVSKPANFCNYESLSLKWQSEINPEETISPSSYFHSLFPFLSSSLSFLSLYLYFYVLLWKKERQCTGISTYRAFMNMCFKYFDYQTMKEAFILHYLIHIMLKTSLQYYVTNSKIEVLKNISFFY